MLSLSFLLPQDNINEPTDKRQGECHPSQNVGIAVRHWLLCLDFVIMTHYSVDDSRTHHKQTRQDLEDGREVEASTLDQFKELKQERDEREEAEEHSQDHEGLHRLDPVFIAG